MIDRQQVLHVARLARLELSDEEIDRMAGELSGILEHVDRIAALDLDDVEPTTHVVRLANVLRADTPDPSLPRELALENAPGSSRRRLPSPVAAGVTAELLELTRGRARSAASRAVSCRPTSSSMPTPRPSRATA